MAATTKVTSGAGLRRVQVYLIDDNGYPSGDQAGLAGYDGVEISGANAYEYTVPQFQPIVHIAKDRKVAQDQLPPTEGMSFTITSSKQDLNLDAILTGTLVQALGEAQMDGMGTSNQGAEPDVCLITWRQALDTAPGAANMRRWQTTIYPVARLIPNGGAAGAGQGEQQTYTGFPGIATKSPWGVAFTAINNGFVSAEMLRFHSEFPFMIERFDAIATSKTYTLTWTPISVAKTYATLAGVVETVASVNTSGKTATITSAPTVGQAIVIGYETSDTI